MGSFWRGQSIESAMARGGDNFHLLRHFLALAVIVSHAFSVGTGNGADEPLHASTGFALGEHAVNGFFAISGFLVTMSFVRRGPLDYMLARTLRIAPALIAAVFVCAFVMGPIMTTLPLADYLRDQQLWRFVQATLTTLKSTASLPGVFADNPFHFPLGTVWTLKYEIICYGVVLALGVAGALRHRMVVLGLVVGLVVACLGLDIWYPEAAKGTQTSIRLPLIFLLGSVFYLYREKVRFSALFIVILAMVTWICADTPLYRTLLFVTEGYGILWLALGMAPLLRKPPRPDLSYGLYLYGWPVQQVLFVLFPTMSAAAMISPAMVLSAVIAAASWYAIEQPALKLKGRLMHVATRRHSAAV